MEMKKKNVKIGCIWVNDVKSIEQGEVVVKKVSSIKLGNRMKKDHPKYNPDYDLSVEITVKDGNGKVVAHSVDGFVNLRNPRDFKPDPEKEQATRNVPENLKYELVIPKLG